MKTSTKLLTIMFGVALIAILYVLLNIRYLLETQNKGFPDIKANYNNVSKEYNLGYFNKLSVKNNIRVSYIPSSESKMIVHTDKEFIEMVDYEIENKSLTLKTGKNKIGGVIDIELFTDSLNFIFLENGSRIETDSFKVENCSIELNNAGKFNGFINANTLNVKCNNASTATIEGTCQNLNAILNERSILFARNFTCENASFILTGISKITADVKDVLTVNIDPGCELTYFGNPVLKDVNIENGARIVKGGQKEN